MPRNKDYSIPMSMVKGAGSSFYRQYRMRSGGRVSGLGLQACRVWGEWGAVQAGVPLRTLGIYV